MGINLEKGQKISLAKEAGGELNSVVMGLGWDAVKKRGFLGFGGGGEIDLDASCFLFDEQNELRDLVYFGQLRSQDGSIQHSGDNRTGEGDGDDEQIIIDLGKVPADVQKIAISVTIHDAEARGQNFGMVSSAFIRCVNADGNSEITRFDLSEDASVETAMIFGEVYRHNGEWKFKAIGQGFKGGLGPLAKNYGVNV